MEILNETVTFQTIAYILAIFFVIGIIVHQILRYTNRLRMERDLGFNSASDVLKFIPIEAIFSIVLKYNHSKEGTLGFGGYEKEYVLIEKRKVHVIFDFTSIIEHRDYKTKTLKLNKIPEPIVEIHKEPISIRDYNVKNKKGILNKSKNVDIETILETRAVAVNMIKEVAEKSGIKELALRKLNSRTEMLQNILRKKDWNLVIEK